MWIGPLAEYSSSVFATSVLFALALLKPATPLHAEMTFKLGGSDVGKNVYDESADGSFKSHTDVKIGATSIESDLTGAWKDGHPTNIVFHQSSGANHVVLTIKGDKITIENGSKPREIPFTYKGSVFFANFHPQLARNLGDAYHADLGGEQKLNIFFIEAAQALDVKVAAGPTRNGRRGDTTEVANSYTITLPNVVVSFYTAGTRRTVAMDAPSQQFQAVDSEVTGVLSDPMAAFPELSQTTFKAKTVSGVKVPMRDGVNLVHDAVMPDAPGKYPVILVRTPYGRKDQAPLGGFYATRGYVYIVQDVRGREDSDGEFDPMVNERKDGYDTIQWIAKQPWCDGNVGMIGGSYLGYVQWAAAVEHPAALKCIVPQVSPPDAFTNIPYEYGTLPLLADVWWLNVVRNKTTDLAGSLATLAPKPAGFISLPLTDVPKNTFGYDLPMLKTWLKRDRAADWKGFDIEKDVASVKIPVLNISGWWDGDGIGTELHWTKLQAAHKANQWLIEGPWTHAFNTTTKLGENDFGPGAIKDLDSIYLRWFDTWLKHKSVNLDKMDRATVFMTGENKWHQAATFPEPGAQPVKWFLGKGVLGGKPGDGETKYTYDPKAVASVADLPKPLSTDVSLKANSLFDKPGNVLFKSEPLAADTSFEGSMTLHAYVRTDVVDTDLYAILVDIDASGEALLTTPAGKLRLAYRNGFAKPELLQPGKVYEVTVRPWWYAHRFPKGHRIGLMLTSSIFPGTARNLNTGEPIATATKMVTAHVEILHDKAHPTSFSWYKLP